MLIAEVSVRTGLSVDTLRYYDQTGLVPHIARQANGVRNFTEDNIHWIEFIKCMRAAGMPIGVLVEYVQLFKMGDATIETRRRLMEEQYEIMQGRLNVLKETVDRLKNKLDSYDEDYQKVAEYLKPSEEK